MNKYQIALNRVEVALDNRYTIDNESLVLLQKLVDRATPKKPYLELGYEHCKSCGEAVEDDYLFCHLCGQAIYVEEGLDEDIIRD